ncbi:MAG: sortase [Anaerolineales bacterium]|nr:sortase [Anaerolineales bacterium]
MKDRRSVDDLSIEELERILKIKKSRAREERLRQYRQTGRALQSDIDMSQAEDWSPPRRKLQIGRITGRALWILEITAVAGLVYLGYDLWQAREVINKEVKEVISSEIYPTLSPTPIIKALVLPGGHVPPTDPGGARPNNSEIPENLRPLVQALPPVIIPTPGARQATRIVIPSIQVDAPIVQGDGWEQLRRGVGQHIGTASPGQKGNLVLSAHNDIFGEIFKNLDMLIPGDIVTINTMGEQFTYVIKETEIVEPTAVDVMDPTTTPTLTLISCYPYLIDNKRIVVFGELQKS